MRKVYFLVPSFYLVVDIKREIKWRVVGAIKRSSVNEETLFPTLQRVLEEKERLVAWKKSLFSWKPLLIKNNKIVQKVVFCQAWNRYCDLSMLNFEELGFLASFRLILALQAKMFIKKKLLRPLHTTYMIIASLKKWGFVSLFIISFHDKEHYLPISFSTTQVFYSTLHS